MTRLTQLANLVILSLVVYTVYIYDWNDAPNLIQVKRDYSGVYHSYDNTVDVRIIVLAFNRAKSLAKCLNSLRHVVLDDLQVSLEVWIDRDKETGLIDSDTMNVARDFRWRHGPINVWIHGRHVGLYGQWLYTWRPQVSADGVVSTSELALFVEDDVDVSSFGLRWLAALHKHLRHRDDIACYTLQDENALLAIPNSKQNNDLPKPTDTPVYLYRIPGSWAMAPHPEKWLRFQDWYEKSSKKPDFRPYVKEAPVNTKWYKDLERRHREDSMWTMWFIYFMSEQMLFCAYSNLPAYTRRNDVSLSANRKEIGLHYTVSEQAGKRVPLLLTRWHDSFVSFPQQPAMYDFTGKRLDPHVTARYKDDFSGQL